MSTELITASTVLNTGFSPRSESLSRLIYISSRNQSCSWTRREGEADGTQSPSPASSPRRSPLPVWTQRLAAFRLGPKDPRRERRQCPLVAAAFQRWAKLPSETCFMSWGTSVLNRRCSVGMKVFCRPGRSRCHTCVGLAPSSRGGGVGAPGHSAPPADPGRPRLARCQWDSSLGLGTCWGSVHPDFFGGLLPLVLHKSSSADILKTQQWVGCGGRAPHAKAEQDPEGWWATARPKGVPRPARLCRAAALLRRVHTGAGGGDASRGGL